MSHSYSRFRPQTPIPRTLSEAVQRLREVEQEIAQIVGEFPELGGIARRSARLPRGVARRPRSGYPVHAMRGRRLQ